MTDKKNFDGVRYVLDQVASDILENRYFPIKNPFNSNDNFQHLGAKPLYEIKNISSNRIGSNNNVGVEQYIGGVSRFPSDLYWSNNFETDLGDSKIDLTTAWKNFKEGITDAGIESLYHVTGGAADRIWSDLNGVNCKIQNQLGRKSESYADCFRGTRHKLDQKYQLAQSRSPNAVQFTREAWDNIDKVTMIKKFIGEAVDKGLGFAFARLMANSDFANSESKGIGQEMIDRYSSSEATDFDTFIRDMLKPTK